MLLKRLLAIRFTYGIFTYHIFRIRVGVVLAIRARYDFFSVKFLKGIEANDIVQSLKNRNLKRKYMIL